MYLTNKTRQTPPRPTEPVPAPAPLHPRGRRGRAEVGSPRPPVRREGAASWPVSRLLTSAPLRHSGGAVRPRPPPGKPQKSCSSGFPWWAGARPSRPPLPVAPAVGSGSLLAWGPGGERVGAAETPQAAAEPRPGSSSRTRCRRGNHYRRHRHDTMTATPQATPRGGRPSAAGTGDRGPPRRPDLCPSAGATRTPKPSSARPLAISRAGRGENEAILPAPPLLAPPRPAPPRRSTVLARLPGLAR